MTQQNPQPPTRSPWHYLPRERHATTLHPADATALDALIAELAGSMVPPTADAQRVERVKAWLGVLAVVPAARPSSKLLEKTLEAVERDRMSVLAQAVEPALPERWVPGRHFGELASMAVAAGLMLAILIPGLGYVRQNAKRTACATNLMAMGSGFANYAADYSGSLPALPAGLGHNWLGRPTLASDVSTDPAEHSNTANLLPLVRLGYVTQDRLVDPARGDVVPFDPMASDIPDAARNYSYLNMPGRLRPKWNRTRELSILADRNPLFSTPSALDAFANSFNHGRTGNNVLMSDGSMIWAPHPNVGPNGDNIWTIGTDNRTQYSGVEKPQVATDVFLAP